VGEIATLPLRCAQGFGSPQGHSPSAVARLALAEETIPEIAAHLSGARKDRKEDARLSPPARAGLHDLERAHYSCVWNSVGGIATLPLRCAQGFGSPQGHSPFVVARLALAEEAIQEIAAHLSGARKDRKEDARLQPRVRAGLHDLERAHYSCTENIAGEIATPRQVGARKDTSSVFVRHDTAGAVFWRA